MENSILKMRKHMFSKKVFESSNNYMQAQEFLPNCLLKIPKLLKLKKHLLCKRCMVYNQKNENFNLVSTDASKAIESSMNDEIFS